MPLDRFPKKPCKHCKKRGHFSYQCRLNPKRILKLKASIGIHRKPINRVGKQTKQWFITRATWIRKNPPPIDGKYWECYLHIHPWCPGRIDVQHLTLDHVVARSHDASLSFKQTNLKPACYFCNSMKGSKKLDVVRKTSV